VFALFRLFIFQLVACLCLAARVAADRRFAAIMLALALAAVTTSPAWAQDKANPPAGKSDVTSPESNPRDSKLKANATVKAGVRSRVGSAWNCDIPDQIPPVWGRADHGTVEISRGNGPQCGRESMALAEIFYTSEPGFKGIDKVYLLGWLLRGNIDQTYTILVK
jgi:hypothetical protein